MVLVSKERYLQDNLSIRLGNLASNLAKIESRCQAGSDRDLVKSLLRESKFFIEWTAPEFEIELAAELVELQVQLARWQYRLSQIWNDAKERQTVGVHLNFEENQEFKAFWEWGIGNWEWEKECFCKYEMLPTVAKKARFWSDRVLELSGLLSLN